jgi:hypothetical protein
MDEQCPASALWASAEPNALALPFVEGKLRAGFPPPADDFSIKRQDLNELLITHPLATFFWRVSGRSMVEAGIDGGDLLVVHRAITPVHQYIVVAQVDGDFTVKYWRRLCPRAGKPSRQTEISLRLSDPYRLHQPLALLTEKFRLLRQFRGLDHLLN